MTDAIGVMMNRFPLADAVSVCRIAASLLMLFTAVFGGLFFLLYTVAGLSDLLDGAVARKTHTESRRGARLDSACDLIFVIAVLYLLLPFIIGSAAMWVLAGIVVIVAVKGLTYALGYRKYRRYAPLHTYGNKAVGLCLFLAVYLLPVIGHVGVLYAALIAVALLASLEELVITATAEKYDSDRVSLFLR
ncbi:MAG: CDP-alcohol phosphatidyltransferase family protein [Methanomethylophilus sp.]|nr:CDP-alcohol phosphatidyltransferase family protein [Methanomethylophilus sp.]MDD4669070.1 CDP-alcohol phosphatidyltransferase family protein [Methanomethylophilus sp.]